MTCDAPDDGVGAQPGSTSSAVDDTDVSEAEVAVNISDLHAAAAGPECPICLEPKMDIVALICGHIVCHDCKIALIEHGLLEVCPLCRFPFTSSGAARHAQYYQGADNVEIHPGVVDRIVQVNPAPVRVRGGRPRIRRRGYDECMCNVCVTGIGLILVVSFWIMIIG